MSYCNKVVWTEGLFLLPQLFQQQERYLEHVVNARAMPISQFFWGFSRLELDTDSLNLGKVALRQAGGLFPDGTPFDAPAHDALPAPLGILPEHIGKILSLSLPVRMPNTEEVSFGEKTGAPTRFTAFEQEIADVNVMGMGPQTVQVAGLRLRLLVKDSLPEADMGLDLALVREVGSDGRVTLDPDFVPTCNICSASERLERWHQEIYGLVRLRAEELARNMSLGGQTVEVADYLLLQALNRYEPLFGHLAKVRHFSPETFYCLLLTLDGELSTFLRFSTRRPAPVPPYSHDQAGASIRPLVESLRVLLNTVLERGAQSIALKEQGTRRYLAVFSQGEADIYTAIVLGVRADVPREVLQRDFPAKTKIAPQEQLNRILGAHLPGLTLLPLPLAPRQIPFNSGVLYFEVQREGPLWEGVRQYGGLGLQVMSDFPELSLELWGIRDR